MTPCPACRRDVSAGTTDCPFCGVIFSKWKGSVVSPRSGARPTEGALQELPTLLKPCPACGRELAGARVMDRVCPYCSVRLPDGFDPRPDPAPPPPPLPPTREELEFAAQPVWKQVWLARPWWVVWGSFLLLALDLNRFCLGEEVPLLLTVPLTLVAPIITMTTCPVANWPLAGLLMGVWVCAFRRGLHVARTQSYTEPFYAKIAAIVVVVLNLAVFVGGAFAMLIMWLISP